MGSNICLQRSNDDLMEFLAAILAVEVFMMIFFLDSKVYDLSTAMFFAFGLGFLARGLFAEFYVMFPLTCLNRETSFLLIVIVAIYFFRRLSYASWIIGILYQILAFMITRLWMMEIFANSPGESYYFRPVEIFGDHLERPWQSLILVSSVILVVWMCTRNWREKPMLLRTAFVVLAPSLTMMYFLFGWVFEIRVFAEVYPVVWVLMTPTLPSPKYPAPCGYLGEGLDS